MDTKNPSIDDLLGILFLRSQDLRPINGYFECINLIRPLLDKLDSQSHASGFYLNVGNARLNSVRLSYFTNHESKTQKVINDFLKGNSNVTAFDFKKPKKIDFSYYCDNELRFRRFLCTYTKIGLDLLDFDILYSRRLVAEYRLVYSPQKISCRPLFEPIFRKHSNFFNQLNASNKRQLWEDLNYWHPIPKTEFIADWAHMMVNMLLPGDWIYMKKYFDLFLNRIPKQPITGRKKAEMLKLFNLDLPEGWNRNN